MNQKIKYAIIGTGAMGREHIRNIEIIENAEVVALCDTYEDSIKASYELANNKSIEKKLKSFSKYFVNFFDDPYKYRILQFVKKLI